MYFLAQFKAFLLSAIGMILYWVFFVDFLDYSTFQIAQNWLLLLMGQVILFFSTVLIVLVIWCITPSKKGNN
jgi:uncharacterized membrane protein YpjA